MEIYINGNLRNDISPMIGGSLSTTEARVTSSALSVEIPISQAPLKEFDYIEIKESGSYIFSGTILSAKQRAMDNIDLVFRVYDLTIASNADFMSTVFADLGFPEGASVTQILLGNHPSDAWYSADFGEFYGLNYRIEAQGISILEVDRFDNVILEEPSYLWGQKLYDVLNTLSDVCGAYWRITNTREFLFKTKSADNSAPEIIDRNSSAYGVEVERDGYTLYSAVRVVGGEGSSAPVRSGIASSGYTDLFPVDGVWERTSSTVITSKYPIASISGTIAQVCSTGLPAGVPSQVRVGFKGLHDDDANYQALTSYGGNKIEMKDGYTWLDTNTKQGFISISSYFVVNVYVRLVDNALAEEIKNQRGGSGIVEYLYEDRNLTNFSDAALTADAFLKNNAKRAHTIKFKSLTPGWEVGQNVFINLPYYGITEMFFITATTATTVLENDSILWETEVEASNIHYRDKFLTLYYTPKKITFSFGGDYEAADGIFIKDDISIQTQISAYTTGSGTVFTWALLEAAYSSWILFQQNISSWGSFENLELRWETLGNYLLPWAKEKIINLLTGNGTANDTILLNVVSQGMFVTLLENGTEATDFISLQSDPIITQDSITATYYVLPNALKKYISSGWFRSTDPVTGENRVIEEFPLGIDKSSSNPMGEFALTIVVRHSIV